MKRLVLLFMLLTVLPDLVSGQSAPDVGVRVRVSTSRLPTVSGLLLASSRDSLMIGLAWQPNSPLVVARGDVRKFELGSGGQNMARTMSIGAQLAGAAGAVTFGIHHLSTRKPGPQFGYDRGDLIAAGLQGAAWGVLIGALGGAVIGRELWRPAEMPQANDAALPLPDSVVPLQTELRFGRVESGTRLRLHLHDGSRIEGRFDGIANTTVRLLNDSTQIVSAASIAEIYERRHMTGRGLKIGALTGAAVTGALSAAVLLLERSSEDVSSDEGFEPEKSILVTFVLAGTATGGVIGAFLGSHVKGWRKQSW